MGGGNGVNHGIGVMQYVMACEDVGVCTHGDERMCNDMKDNGICDGIRNNYLTDPKQQSKEVI